MWFFIEWKVTGHNLSTSTFLALDCIFIVSPRNFDTITTVNDLLTHFIKRHIFDTVSAWKAPDSYLYFFMWQ